MQRMGRSVPSPWEEDRCYLEEDFCGRQPATFLSCLVPLLLLASSNPFAVDVLPGHALFASGQAVRQAFEALMAVQAWAMRQSWA